jgi:hypothetical protein
MVHNRGKDAVVVSQSFEGYPEPWLSWQVEGSGLSFMQMWKIVITNILGEIDQSNVLLGPGM